jgi:hypothetical protein
MTRSISLREFIAHLDGLPPQGTLWTEAVTLMLDARGPQNAHLAFPIDPITGKPKLYYRDTPLSLDERVYGDHLLLTYRGHDPTLVLTEHKSLDELQSEILGPAGSLNCWITAQFAFHKLKPLPFSIQYTDLSGERKTFSIDHPEPVPNYWPVEIPWYRDVQFEWMPKKRRITSG